MITNGKQSDEIDKWHYIALKSVRTDNGFNRPIRSLSRLFRGITSNNNGGFYCLGCLRSFRTDNALKKQERLYDNHDYCHIEIPINDNNTLKYNRGEISLKEPWVIYVVFKCLSIKQQSCQNDPEESYTERKAIREPCGYSSGLVSSFDSKQNKRSFHRGRDCTKKFGKNLQEHTTKIINFEEKEMMKSKKYVIYVKKSFVMIKMKKINLNYIKKLEIIVIIQENLEELLIAFVI